MGITVVPGASGNGSAAITAKAAIQPTICTTPNVPNTMYLITFTWSIGAWTTTLPLVSCMGIGLNYSTGGISGTNVIRAGPNQAVSVTFGELQGGAGTIYWSYNSVGVTIT